MAHIEDAPASLAAHCEGFDQQIVNRLSVGYAFLEFNGLLSKLDIGKLLHRRLAVIDSRDERTHLLDFAFILRPEDFCEDGIEHGVPVIILADRRAVKKHSLTVAVL